MVSPVRAAQATFSRLGRTEELPGFLLLGRLPLPRPVVRRAGARDRRSGVLAAVGRSASFRSRCGRPPSSQLLDQAEFGMPMRFVLRVLAGLVVSDQIDGDERGAHVRGRSLSRTSWCSAPEPCTRSTAGSARSSPWRPATSRARRASTTLRRAGRSRSSSRSCSCWRPCCSAPRGCWSCSPASWPSPCWRPSRSLTPAPPGPCGSRSGPPGSPAPLRQIQEFLDDYQPEVVVHLSGPAEARLPDQHVAREPRGPRSSGVHRAARPSVVHPARVDLDPDAGAARIPASC